MDYSFSAIRRSKTLHTITVFASGNTLAMLLGVVGSLVQARYIKPEDMGIFRTFGILVGYMTFLHLGVFDGLQREIPLQLGGGNQAKAERAASACLAWIMFISLASMTLFLSLALRSAWRQEWMLFWGWLAYMPLIFATFYGGYLGTTFRTSQQFIALSKTSVIQATAGTLVLPLIPFLGYYGACLRTAAGSIANIFFLHRWRPLKVRPRLDWHGFRDVIRIGLPLSGIGFISTSLWVSLEGTLILAWFGIKALGLYAVAVFVRGVLVQLAQNMNQVMNVKVYEQYGHSGRVRDCLRLVFKPAGFSLLASLPLMVAGWFALPWVVRLLIPKYIDAISMMRVMLLAMPITFLSLPITILWARARWIDCFAGVISGFLAFAGFSYVCYRMNFGIIGILIASVVGQAINVMVSYVIILRLAIHEKRIAACKGEPCYGSDIQV